VARVVPAHAAAAPDWSGGAPVSPQDDDTPGPPQNDYGNKVNVLR